MVDSFGKAFNACPDCYFKACPKANDKSGLCDVSDEMAKARAKEIDDSHFVYEDKVNAKRVLFKKSVVAYEMKANLFIHLMT